MMRFTGRLRILNLIAALAVASSWAFHLAGTPHQENGRCQVCAVSCSPELNADCGSELLSAPQKFELLRPASCAVPASNIPSPAFLGRAPPLA